MNGWERWAKRLLKGFIWAFAVVGLALLVGIPPTWHVFVLALGAELVSFCLDETWPTRETA